MPMFSTLIAFTGKAVIANGSQGNTNVVLSPKKPRRYLEIQNTHATQDIWMNFDAAAVVGTAGIKIPAGTTWRPPDHYVPQGAINIIGSGAATTFAWTEITG